MGITQKLESTLFLFGFQECRKKDNLNFLKLADNITSNVPPISLTNVPGVSLLNVPPVSHTNVPEK